MSRRWQRDPEEEKAGRAPAVPSPPSAELSPPTPRTFALALNDPRWFEVCVRISDPMAIRGMPWNEIEDELLATLADEDDPAAGDRAADPEWDYSERLPRQTDPARPIEGTADEPPPTLRELVRNVSSGR
jgi:hypothetical protein